MRLGATPHGVLQHCWIPGSRGLLRTAEPRWSFAQAGGRGAGHLAYSAEQSEGCSDSSMAVTAGNLKISSAHAPTPVTIKIIITGVC